MRIRRDGRWIGLGYQEVAEQVHAASIGLRELGLRRRRPGRDPLREPARVGYYRLRLPRRALHRRPDLPDAARPTRPSTSFATPVRRPCSCPRRRTCRRRWLFGTGSPRSAHIIAFDPDARGPGVLGFDELLALRARCPRALSRLASPGAPRDARRPRHAHLHLGHHGRPQGRHADARQHRLERHDLRRPVRASARATSASRSCRSPTSSSGCSGTTAMFYAGVVDQLRRQHRHGPADMQDRRPDDDGVGAAAVREDLRPGARQRPVELGAAPADLRLGPPRRRGVGRADARRQPGPAGGSRSSTRSPTAWSSPSSGRAPADGSGSSSRAARRSRPRSRDSSSPRGCRSSRATGSPRPRR